MELIILYALESALRALSFDTKNTKWPKIIKLSWKSTKYGRKCITWKSAGKIVWIYRLEKVILKLTVHRNDQKRPKSINKYIKSNLHPKVEVRKNAWRKLVTDMLSGLLSEEDEYLRSLAWRLDFSRHYYKAWGFRGSLEKWEKKNLVDFRTVKLFSSS